MGALGRLSTDLVVSYKRIELEQCIERISTVPNPSRDGDKMPEKVATEAIIELNISIEQYS